MKRILVVAAHPDDEVLGCGATAARLVDEGHEVYFAVLGEGITSRYNKREDADPALLKQLRARCRQAAALIGVKDLFLYGLPDNRFDTVPLLDLIKIVEDLVFRLNPHVIYTHHHGDLNIDHGLVHRAVLTATRPMQGQPVEEIYSFEVASSSEWAFQHSQPFRPTVFVDVEKTLERKVKALECYDSELRTFPHPRSAQALHAIAQRWGSTVGTNAAEAFELVRAIR